MTRRDFLKATGAGAALLGATGCGGHLPVGDPHKNVILVILDSLRKDHVGAYGNDRVKTPTLDGISREGLRFTNARPETMPTIQARRAIYTGKRTFPLRPPDYGWSMIPGDQVTLTEILRGAGYSTFLSTDAYVQFPMNFTRGFGTYRQIRGQENDPYMEASSVTEKELEPYIILGDGKKARQYIANVRGRRKEEEWFAPRVFLSAAELLEEASRARPFFMVVDSFDPHEPWDPPKKYVGLYDDGYDDREPLHDNYGKDDYLTDRQLLRMRALYAAEVTMADRWLGNFLEKAHDLGVMEDTLLVVVSDHGHLLGEHGYTGKPPEALYPELTDIVFMIRHPQGKAAGLTSDFFASTHDVAPTILGFLDVDPPSPMEGQDLGAILEGKDPEPRPHLTLAHKDYICSRDERRVVLGREDGTGAELYDARNDPAQTRDLAEEEPGTVERMFEEYVFPDLGGRPSVS